MSKQLQFTWMNDRQFIDKRAENDKMKRLKRKNEWIEKNLKKKTANNSTPLISKIPKHVYE